MTHPAVQRYRVRETCIAAPFDPSARNMSLDGGIHSAKFDRWKTTVWSLCPGPEYNQWRLMKEGDVILTWPERALSERKAVRMVLTAAEFAAQYEPAG